MSVPNAFQKSAFQNNAFQTFIQSIVVTDITNKLQLPVNCVMGGDQPEEGGGLSDLAKRLIFRE